MVFVNFSCIAILAVIAGADGFVSIETYGKAKLEWLETFLDLAHGYHPTIPLVDLSSIIKRQ